MGKEEEDDEEEEDEEEELGREKDRKGRIHGRKKEDRMGEGSMRQDVGGRMQGGARRRGKAKNQQNAQGSWGGLRWAGGIEITVGAEILHF